MVFDDVCCKCEHTQIQTAVTLKKSKSGKHLLSGHFLASNWSFKPLSVEIGSQAWAVRVARNKNKNKKKARAGATRIFYHHVLR